MGFESRQGKEILSPQNAQARSDAQSATYSVCTGSP